MTINRIKEAMEIRDLKQSDIVEKTGINKGALSSYISGRYEPKQTNLYLIANALNVNVAWLMGYDVPMEIMDSLSNEKPITNEHDGLEDYQLKVRDAILDLNESDSQDVLDYIAYVKSRRRT